MPSLSQRYRPGTFADITGQRHITETLRREVATGKLGHAFLFCGPRGVGKTTSARVFAKALLCLSPNEGEPCNQCPSCTAFNENKHLDVIELDAATHTGVDNVRESIIEAVKYAPTLSKRKVYILDEVHMFSTSSWNALLKTLEEPPAHAFFILATTEWHKVPATIVSRCQRFEFKRIPDPELLERVNDLAKQEDWSLDPAVANLIVSRSEGCVRDAETLLGQLGSLDSAKITLDMAGLVIPPSHIPLAANLLRLWGERKHAEALNEAQRLFDEGIALIPLFDDLLLIIRRLLAASGDPSLAERWKQGMEEDQQVADLVGRFTPGELHDLSLLLLERRRDAKAGLDPLFALQLAGTLVACDLLRRSAGGTAHAPNVPVAPSQAIPKKEMEAPLAKPAPTESVATPPPDDEPRYEEIPPLKEEEPLPTPASVAPTESAPADLDIDIVRAKWTTAIRSIEEKNHSLSFILKLARPESLQGNVIMIRFQYPFHRDKVLNDLKHRRLVEAALEQMFSTKLSIDGIVGAEGTAANPAAQAGNTDMVAAILKAFGGQVVE